MTIQSTLRSFNVPEQAEPIVRRLWGSPDVWLWFGHSRQQCRVGYCPSDETAWTKICVLDECSWSMPITTRMLVERILTENPEYDYELVDATERQPWSEAP